MSLTNETMVLNVFIVCKLRVCQRLLTIIKKGMIIDHTSLRVAGTVLPVITLMS